jgi:hypothetical protein
MESQILEALCHYNKIPDTVYLLSEEVYFGSWFLKFKPIRWVWASGEDTPSWSEHVPEQLTSLAKSGWVPQSLSRRHSNDPRASH